MVTFLLQRMIILIIVFSAIIILILVITFTGSSSDMQSTNRSPIANLGEDELLSCFVPTENEDATLRQVSVTWQKKGLTGVVHQYENGGVDLTRQNSLFTGRTELFPDALIKGNASLLLRDVTLSDEGEYTCEVSSSDGGGSLSIHLRAAAFTAPTFTFSNGVLTAEANRWFPQPRATWSDQDSNILQGNTSFTQNSEGIFSVVSTLRQVNVSESYVCRIQNDMVMAVAKATVTGSGVLNNSYFVYSTASSPPSSHLNYMIAILGFCYLL